MSAMQEAKAILSGCLFVPVERIADDASIQSIKHLDSLSFATLVVELERHTGREFDVMELLSLRTVRDIASLLERAR